VRIEVSVALLTLLLVGTLSLAFNVPQVKTELAREIIVVPDSYPTIQEAINSADEGDTIFVRSGTYYENLVVNKSVSLVGEDRETTIIDGNYTGNAMNITASNVTIQGFTILTHTWLSGHSASGIYLNHTRNCIIANNTITDNSLIGIYCKGSSNNTISGNIITKNEVAGIYIGWSGNNNSIANNNITANGNGLESAGIRIINGTSNVIFRNHIAENVLSGIYIEWVATKNYIIENNITKNNFWGMRIYQTGNFIYHNNFIDNIEEHVEGGGGNTWHNGCVGNYWSDYDGEDLDGDGIGDTNLPWEGVDYYPLMDIFWRPRFYWNHGDVNHDLTVNLFDAVKVLRAYGSEPGDSNWDPQCDIVEAYNKIDLYDATLVLLNYGKKYKST
jgi:nitrous oxidase accessory protein